MPTSKFRLQSVLDYRQTLIDTARLELSGLHIRCAEEETLLWSLRASERQVIADLSEQQRVIVNMPDVMRLNEHLNVLGRRIGNQWSAVQRIRGEIERVQSTLIELTKAAKALEKLKERHVQEMALDAMRLERAETGEIAARQHQMAVVR